MIQSGATNVLDIDLETLNTLKTLSEKVTIDRVMHCLRALSNVGLIADSALPLGLELAVVESSLDDPYRHSSPTKQQHFHNNEISEGRNMLIQISWVVDERITIFMTIPALRVKNNLAMARVTDF